ncbi:MAG: hypothetical protein R2681_14135 [Pyrinomonadaceae bacterium]
MRKIIPSIYALVILLLFSTAPVAQSPKQILKDAEKALGNKKSLQSVSSVKRSGLIIRLADGASGTFVMETSKPNFYHSKFDFRGFETEMGFNGKSGWLRDSREGLRTLTGDASEDFKAEAVFRNWQWLDYKKRKEKISGGGRAVVNGKHTDVVVVTTPYAVSIKLYFDIRTKLLLREEMPNGDSVKIFNYSDYRPVNGVKVPFQITTEKAEEKFAIKFDQISFNTEIPPSNFDFPNSAGAELPDIPTLLEQLRANEEKVDNILEDYSYTEKTTKRELDDDGTLRVTESETYQLSFYKGNRIRRLIEKDGKPLSESEQKDEDKEVAKRVEKIEKEIAKREKREAGQNSDGTPENEGRRISIAEVLRASKLSNPRREMLKGRNVIVFDFEPDPEFDFNNAKSFLKFFGKTAGVMWIDEEDKQVARLEAVLFDSYKVGGGLLAKLRKGASFTLEKERLNDEIWLPSVADINLSVRVLLFGGVKVNQIVESSNYRKFKTEVEDAKVNNPDSTQE